MKLEHVGLQVDDPAAMGLWYQEHLGMRIVRSLGDAAHTLFLADSSGTMLMEIYRNDRVGVPHYGSQDALILHLAFAVDDVAGTRARLLAAGAKPLGEIATTALGDELAMLRDPFGLCIQLARRKVPMTGPHAA